MYSRRLLGGAIFLAMGLCGAAARAQDGGATYEEPFKGKPRMAGDFTLIGTDAAACVKFEPEGLRINMPAGKSRGTTGVATMFGVTGDFEITVRYEVLFEPDMADSGTPNLGTRLSLTANVDTPYPNDASIRRKITPTTAPHILCYRSMRKDFDAKLQGKGATFDVKEKSGRLRLVRKGADITYHMAEGNAPEFTQLATHAFSAEPLHDVWIYGQTSSPKAALDFRITDLTIRAESLPRKKPPPKLEAPPPKAFAQSYSQSFKAGKLPAGWELTGPQAEQCMRFEPTGLLLALPAGWGGERPSTGIRSAFGVKGDFELSLDFDMLKEPMAPDSGKVGTRLTIEVRQATPSADIATHSRTTVPGGERKFVSWMRKGDKAPVAQLFNTDATTGRLRLVRSGADLYFLGSGAGEPLQVLRKYAFGDADLANISIVASTGGEKAILQARVTDLQLRADAIPGLPTSDVVTPLPVVQPPVAIKEKTSPPPAINEQTPTPSAPAAAPPTRSYFWLFVALFAVIGILLAFGVTIGAWLVLSRAKR